MNYISNIISNNRACRFIFTLILVEYTVMLWYMYLLTWYVGISWANPSSSSVMLNIFCVLLCQRILVNAIGVFILSHLFYEHQLPSYEISLEYYRDNILANFKKRCDSHSMHNFIVYTGVTVWLIDIWVIVQYINEPCELSDQYCDYMPYAAFVSIINIICQILGHNL